MNTIQVKNIYNNFLPNDIKPTNLLQIQNTPYLNNAENKDNLAFSYEARNTLSARESVSILSKGYDNIKNTAKVIFSSNEKSRVGKNIKNQDVIMRKHYKIYQKPDNSLVIHTYVNDKTIGRKTYTQKEAASLIIDLQKNNDRLVLDKSITHKIRVINNGGNHQIKFNGKANLELVSQNGANMITGSSQNDIINTKGGITTIYGRKGNDTINATGEEIYVDGGKDNDNINIKAKTTAIAVGGYGHDSLDISGQNKVAIDDEDNGNINFSDNENTKKYILNKGTKSLGSSLKISGSRDFLDRVQDDLFTAKSLPSTQFLLRNIDRFGREGKRTYITEGKEDNNYCKINNLAHAIVNLDGTPNIGSSSTIIYNPENMNTKKLNPHTKPFISLMHEMLHSYTNAGGFTQPERIIKLGETEHNLNTKEHQILGNNVMGGTTVRYTPHYANKHNPEILTENRIRKELTLPPRTTY